MENRSFAAMSSQTDAVRKFATLRRRMAVAVLCGCCVCAGTATAAEEENANIVEFTPFFGLMGGGSFEDPNDGSDRDVEDDTVYGLFVNVVADIPERQYELLYARQSSSVEGNAPFDLDTQYLQIGGTVAYPQTKYVHPYFGATVGVTHFSPDAAGLDDETKFSVTVGGGLRIPITDHFGVRVDIRSFITFLENDSEIFCISVNTTTCAIKPKSDTYVQYAGSLGFSFGF